MRVRKELSCYCDAVKCCREAFTRRSTHYSGLFLFVKTNLRSMLIFSCGIGAKFAVKAVVEGAEEGVDISEMKFSTAQHGIEGEYDVESAECKSYKWFAWFPKSLNPCPVADFIVPEFRRESGFIEERTPSDTVVNQLCGKGWVVDNGGGDELEFHALHLRFPCIFIVAIMKRELFFRSPDSGEDRTGIKSAYPCAAYGNSRAVR